MVSGQFKCVQVFCNKAVHIQMHPSNEQMLWVTHELLLSGLLIQVIKERCVR